MSSLNYKTARRYTKITGTKKLLYVVLALFLSLLVQSCSPLYDGLGGAFKYEPEDMAANLSEGARALIDKSFGSYEGKELIDYHVHIIGMGEVCSECLVHEHMKNFHLLNPFPYFQFQVYLSASGVKNKDHAESEYLDRLVRLYREIGRPVKAFILAFDKHYDLQGEVVWDKTQLYTTNEHVYDLSLQYPDIFIPVISVHPYRDDAIDKLNFWADKGVRIVKWLPNSMGMDPSNRFKQHPELDLYYQTMQERNMILLSHTGHEQAIAAHDDQYLGNPLLLIKPLKKGVKVIMAHSASLKECVDLESPERPMVACSDLFLKMMGKSEYDGLLFGELSATLQFNRMEEPVSEILQDPDLQKRIVNGTDYPLPAVNILIQTRELARKGYITGEERELVNEIYHYNPVLFDFVLKRTIRHPGTDQKLSADIFFRNLLEEAP